MSRYQLPLDLLGGGEIEAREVWGGCAGGRPEYHLADGFTLLAPAGKPLDEIITVPPEPPVGAYRVGGVLCMRPSSEPAKCWVYQIDGDMFDEATFAALCSNFGSDVVPLVPDPFAEPVTLPWEGDTTYGAKVGVRDLDTGSVNEWIRQSNKESVVATLTPALARDKARALWAAADAAEAQR